MWKLNLRYSIALGHVIFHLRPAFLTGLVLELAGKDLVRFFRLPEHQVSLTIEVGCLDRSKNVRMILAEKLHAFPLQIFLSHVRDHISINRPDLLPSSLIPEFGRNLYENFLATDSARCREINYRQINLQRISLDSCNSHTHVDKMRIIIILEKLAVATGFT